ncbi:MAG: hypothetical protein ACE5KE_07885 [Methanosarcinales archaeon]
MVNAKSITKTTTSLPEIDIKVDDISTEAWVWLEENQILKKLVAKTVSKIKAKLEKMRIEHSISLYVYQDVENPVWKDFVIYIKDIGVELE